MKKTIEQNWRTGVALVGVGAAFLAIGVSVGEKRAIEQNASSNSAQIAPVTPEISQIVETPQPSLPRGATTKIAADAETIKALVYAPPSNCRVKPHITANVYTVIRQVRVIQVDYDDLGREWLRVPPGSIENEQSCYIHKSQISVRDVN